MTLIRELIDIPTQVQGGDFVLKLSDGVDTNPTSTVDDYVVTDQLAAAFDKALGLVASALTDGTSKATYLQGSFGSGKSHFMAMLHLLLNHDTHARSKPELHEAIAKWGPKLDGKNMLLVPIHFLDARSIEHKIFGGYVDRIQQLHPEAKLPSIYLGDTILDDELPGIRQQIGDPAFLTGLNQGKDEWGDYANTWTTEALDAALAAPATATTRRDLIAAYIAAYRKTTILESATSGEDYVDLDRGLLAISTHAKDLGYDGVVLFLDELVLWLATRIGDLNFVNAESQKLVKLVEATGSGRPAPIVSFIARQRDLRDLVGDHISGAEQSSLSDNLELLHGRVGNIELASNNLPEVAKRRLLKPIDEAAETELAAAVDQVLTVRDNIKQQLLGTDGNIELLRTVYPFSPALVQVLIDVSEALQRERTALKVMLQLLVDKRDHLEAGHLIPVGDLWDVVESEDAPFSTEMRALFDIARDMWLNKLHPALAETHNVTDETPQDAAERTALAKDSRLLKTILLAALVPNTESFKNLDAARLVALNWGSVTSPIPGQETQDVANKLRNLAGRVGELMIGEDHVNPTIKIRLAKVDTEEIIRRATQSFDTAAMRRQKIQLLITQALGNRLGDDLTSTFEHQWRGTKRPVDVIFGNVRNQNELADNALMASPHRPKLVVDYPFDESKRSRQDDLERLDDWTSRHKPSTTICWLPAFFNRNGLQALGRYVAIDELLKRDRFEQYTTHLSINQRSEAKPLLENVRNQLAAQLNRAILIAYGVIADATKTNDLVEPTDSLIEHYRSLDPSIDIRPTTKPTLAGALDDLCDGIFDTLYPGHPKFEAPITPAQLRTTWQEIQRALPEEDGRILIETSQRKVLRNVANATKIGEMHESYFVLSTSWKNSLDRHLASTEGPVTVGQMRALIDEVPGGPRGLDATVADLIIVTVAGQTDHRLLKAGLGVIYDGKKALAEDTQLIAEQLPSSEEWATATHLTARLFGGDFAKRVNGNELQRLADHVRTKGQHLHRDAAVLVEKIQNAYSTWGIESGNRLETAIAARNLLDETRGADAQQIVQTLATFTAPTSNDAVDKSLGSAQVISQRLERANLALWQGAQKVVGNKVEEVLTTDEFVVSFEKAEREIDAEATKYLSTGGAGKAALPSSATAPLFDTTPMTTTPISTTTATEPAHNTDAVTPQPEQRFIRSADELAKLTQHLKGVLDEGSTIEVSWRTGEST